MTRPHVRDTATADMAAIVAIERDAYRPWCHDRLRRELSQHSRFGVVAVDRGKVVGHMTYILKRSVVEVTRLAVALDRRREGHGTELLLHALSRLDPYKRPTLRMPVPEWCDDVHAWLRSQGIAAVRVEEGDGCDNYLFAATLEACPPRRAAADCEGNVP